MPDALSSQPPTDDTGADVISRFRYQAGIAAYIALKMFEGELAPAHSFGKIDSVYSEHHEDIIVAKSGGKYVAIQVKTRNRRGAPFKATDDAILGAIKSFIHLNEQFGSQIDLYKIVTNHGFSKSENSTDLPHLLLLSKNANASSLEGNLQTFIKKLQVKPKPKSKSPKKSSRTGKSPSPNISSANSGPQEEDNDDPFGKVNIDLSAFSIDSILATLKRTEADDSWPHFDDIDDKLGMLIGCTSEFGVSSASIAKNLGNTLLKEILDKSRLRHNTMQFLLFQNTNDESAKAIITEKKWDKERVLKVIAQAAQAPLLTSSGDSFADMSKDTIKLVKKALRGGLPKEEIDNAKDLSNSAHAFVAEFSYRFSSAEEAIRNLNHIKAILREAYLPEHAKFASRSDVYGVEQLAALRAIIPALWTQNFEHFGIRREHLIGFIWMLTEECTVWWSEEFDLEAS